MSLFHSIDIENFIYKVSWKKRHLVLVLLKECANKSTTIEQLKNNVREESQRIRRETGENVMKDVIERACTGKASRGDLY